MQANLDQFSDVVEEELLGRPTDVDVGIPNLLKEARLFEIDPQFMPPYSVHTPNAVASALPSVAGAEVRARGAARTVPLHDEKKEPRKDV